MKNIRCFLFITPILAGLLEGCGRTESVDAPPPRPIAWTTVVSSDSNRTLRLPGLLRSVDRADLAFEVPGRVVKLEKRLGDRIVAGELLAVLDDRAYRLRLEEGEANHRAAEARERQALQDYERASRLLTSGAVSRQDHDLARQTRDSAGNAVKAAMAAVEIRRKELADTRLLAPYDGTIVERLVEPSQQIAAGAVVYRVQGEGALEVTASVPAEITNALAPRSEHWVEIEQNGSVPISAVLTDVGAQARDGMAVPIILRLSPDVRKAQAGQSVDVILTPRETELGAQGVKIPHGALVAGTGEKTLCFVFDPGSKTVRQREVQILRMEAEFAIVSSGLEAGEIVATRGVAFLREGQQVTLLGTGVDAYNL